MVQPTSGPTIVCPAGCGGPYVVQPGDTLFNIAQRFGTTVQAILNCNAQITNPNQIFAGQVFCVPGAPAPPAPCPAGCGGPYIVQPGDTLFGIAQRFNTTVQQIQRCNPQIVNPNLINPGTFLCVPQGTVGAQPCAPGCGNPYTVQPGDTLFFIAQRFGTTVQAILACNPQITNPNLIFPGQVICVPGAPPSTGCPAGCGNPYTVQPGDTLFVIAQRFGTTVQTLLDCNPQVTNPNLLFPGQVICVPGAPPPGGC